MTEVLINASISEARNVEPFLRLPKALTLILKIPISAPTVDLRNIVMNKKIPKFLHTALYQSKMADTQVGDNLLKSCNIISNLLGEIWEYIHIMDPTVVIPPDANDKFDFFTLKKYESYDVKLSARYWAREMHTLLDVIDNACRMAIKEQTRLSLCLFEVLDAEVSVEFAYNIIMFNTKVQQEGGDNARETYIEFAKMYARMIDKVEDEQLKGKLAKESILYQSLEMDNKLVNHLSWLQKMLYKLPQSTISAWSHQLELVGPWMNRLFIPWMKQCKELGLFPEDYVLQKKKGPIEKVAKALGRPVVTSFEEIQLVSNILKELYMNRDPSDANMDRLDNLCIKRTGLNLVQWSAIIDASLNFKETVFIEGRPESEINDDITKWTKRTKLAKAALDQFLQERAFIDQDSSYQIFLEYLSDTYGDLKNPKQKEELEHRKNRHFPNLSPGLFETLIEFMVEYLVAKDNVAKFKKELLSPITDKARVTVYLREEIAKQQEVYDRRRRLFLTEAIRKFGATRISFDSFSEYIDWYRRVGSNIRIIDEERFKLDTVAKLNNIPYNEIESLLSSLDDVIRADIAKQRLEVELSKHTKRLDWYRGVLSLVIFMLFGILLFSLINAFVPVFPDTPTPFPTNPSTNQPIVPTNEQGPLTVDTNPSQRSAWETLGDAKDWVTSTRVVQAFSNRVDITLQDAGWKAFDWRGRVFNFDFWIYTVLRGGGGTIMTLLYSSVLISTSWRTLYFMYAASSGLSNTIISGLFDENYSETWRRESLRISQASINLGLTIASNVISIQTEYLDNQRQLFGLAAQALQLGPPIVGAVGRRLEAYSESPQRRAVTDRMNEQIAVYTAMLNQGVPPSSSTNVVPLSANDITSPRIEILADENTSTQSTDIVLYTPPPEPDYSDA